MSVVRRPRHEPYEVAHDRERSLAKNIEMLADNAENDPEPGVDIKALAVGLWTNFNEFSVEDIEDALRHKRRMCDLPFNDNSGLFHHCDQPVSVHDFLDLDLIRRAFCHQVGELVSGQRLLR
jgi:hypothetical protein